MIPAEAPREVRVMQETVFGFAAGAVPADAWEVVRFRAHGVMLAPCECAVVLAMEPGGAPLVSLLGADARLTVQRGARVRSLQGVVDLTKKLKTVGEAIGLPLVDHLIVTDAGYFSFLDEGFI